MDCNLGFLADGKRNGYAVNGDTAMLKLSMEGSMLAPVAVSRGLVFLIVGIWIDR